MYILKGSVKHYKNTTNASFFQNMHFAEVLQNVIYLNVVETAALRQIAQQLDAVDANFNVEI